MMIKSNLQVVLTSANVLLEWVADYFVPGQRSPRTTCQRDFVPAFRRIVKSTIEFYF